MKQYTLKSFLVFTYLLFWALFAITGGLVFLKAPDIVLTIMKNICAWTSTFVLVLLFKKLYPGDSFKEFLKRQFCKVSVLDFLIPLLIQAAIIAFAIIIFFISRGESLESIKFTSVSGILPLLLINITSGPMGEELGWRGYALKELQKKHSPLVASLFIGLLWGFWHFPLWIVTGYTGYDLLLYSAFFMLGILSFSVFITYFYNKSKNILVAVWIHFLFNMLMQIVVIEDYRILLFVSILYVLVSVVIVLGNKKTMLQKAPVST